MSEEMEIDDQDEMSLLDYVDGKMRMLGISLNLLDPDGTFKGVPSEKVLREIMQAVREDYRNLSDAILALRDEEPLLSFADQSDLLPVTWKSSSVRSCSLTTYCLSCKTEIHGKWEGEPPYTLICPSCGASHTIEERVA